MKAVSRAVQGYEIRRGQFGPDQARQAAPNFMITYSFLATNSQHGDVHPIWSADGPYGAMRREVSLSGQRES